MLADIQDGERIQANPSRVIVGTGKRHPDKVKVAVVVVGGDEGGRNVRALRTPQCALGAAVLLLYSVNRGYCPGSRIMGDFLDKVTFASRLARSYCQQATGGDNDGASARRGRLLEATVMTMLL